MTLADDYVLVGGGAHDFTVDGPGNHLQASHPEGKGWVARGHDHTHVSTGQVTAYAIGLRSKVPGIVARSTTLHSKPSRWTNWPTASQSIGGTGRLVGCGARCESSGWGQILTGSYPDEERQEWTASSKDHVTPDPGRVIAYAVRLEVTKAI